MRMPSLLRTTGWILALAVLAAAVLGSSAIAGPVGGPKAAKTPLTPAAAKALRTRVAMPYFSFQPRG